MNNQSQPGIVEQLRAAAAPGRLSLYRQAADRIEALEAALMLIRKVCASRSQHDIAVAECFDIATRAIRAARR